MGKKAISKKARRSVIALAAVTGLVLFASSCGNHGGCPAYGKAHAKAHHYR